ncbi:MAG: hypothetical protein ACP5VP_11965 [Candidatus Limnocylindrales bacterium]
MNAGTQPASDSKTDGLRLGGDPIVVALVAALRSIERRRAEKRSVGVQRIESSIEVSSEDEQVDEEESAA